MSREHAEDFYGCDEMAPRECYALAGEYKSAALLLKTNWQRRKPGSRAPFRFNAIHAIELYLTAYLLQSGEPWSNVRGMGHNLQMRHELAAARGLILKKGAVASLSAMSSQRDYLKTRYAEKEATLIQLNRLEATLEHVAKKVSAAFSR
jgi:hypothetical protein